MRVGFHRWSSQTVSGFTLTGMNEVGQWWTVARAPNFAEIDWKGKPSWSGVISYKSFLRHTVLGMLAFLLFLGRAVHALNSGPLHLFSCTGGVSRPGLCPLEILDPSGDVRVLILAPSYRLLPSGGCQRQGSWLVSSAAEVQAFPNWDWLGESCGRHRRSCM